MKLLEKEKFSEAAIDLKIFLGPQNDVHFYQKHPYPFQKKVSVERPNRRFKIFNSLGKKRRYEMEATHLFKRVMKKLKNKNTGSIDMDRSETKFNILY